MPARIRGTVSDVPDFEYESGGTWFDYDTRPADFSNTATGTYSSSGINYKYVRFTSSGTLTLTREGFVDALVVGAGGSGTGGYAGGGGGVIQQTLFLEAGSYAVTVGAAGAVATLGGPSSFANLFALGGSYVNSDQNLLFWVSSTATNGGKATPGQGFGDTGGTGAGGAGGAASGSTSGPGIVSSITGSAVTYGAGGVSGVAAPANTGQGGPHGGGVGASGVVVVRVKV